MVMEITRFTTAYQPVQVFGLKFPATYPSLATMTNNKCCNITIDDGRTLSQLLFSRGEK